MKRPQQMRPTVSSKQFSHSFIYRIFYILSVNGEEISRTYFDYEDNSEHSRFVEKNLPSSTANSQRALQIIKENSEILDKILRKKGEGSEPVTGATVMAQTTNKHQQASSTTNKMASTSSVSSSPTTRISSAAGN